MNRILTLAMLQARRLFSTTTYRVRGGLAQGLHRRGGLGFIPRFGKLSAEETYLSKLSLANMTVLDIGGFEGVYSIFFARAVGPKGQVFTAEPNPANVACIQKNAELNGFANIEVVPMALGARRDSAELTFNPLASGTGSLLRRSRSGNEKTIAVQIETVDHLVDEKRITPPGFVKIDVEGYEPEVLEGMQNTLTAARPQLFIETHDLGMAGKKARDYCARTRRLLDDHGYAVFHVERGVLLDKTDASLFENGHLACTTPGTQE